MLSSLIREGGKRGRDKYTGFDLTVSECVTDTRFLFLHDQNPQKNRKKT